MLVTNLHKRKKEHKILKKQEIHYLLAKTKQIKLVFNTVYGDVKKLTRRTASDKILRDKVFNIAKNSNNMSTWTCLNGA